MPGFESQYGFLSSDHITRLLKWNFSSHMTNRFVTDYWSACVTHQSLTCATMAWCDRTGSGKTHCCCCRLAAPHPPWHQTQVSFATTCNPVPRNTTALGPTEECVHWVIWRRVCVCVFPAALDAPQYTLLWVDKSGQSFLRMGHCSSVNLCSSAWLRNIYHDKKQNLLECFFAICLILWKIKAEQSSPKNRFKNESQFRVEGLYKTSNIT